VQRIVISARAAPWEGLEPLPGIAYLPKAGLVSPIRPRGT